MDESWKIVGGNKNCVYLKLDENNTLEVKKTDEGVIFEVWNNIENEYMYSEYRLFSDLIEDNCSLCESAGVHTSFCDSCSNEFCKKCSHKRTKDYHLNYCKECFDEHLRICNKCNNIEYALDSIDCTECKEWFCDSCYDTEKGDGCYCHSKFAQKHAHDMDDGAYSE